MACRAVVQFIPFLQGPASFASSFRHGGPNVSGQRVRSIRRIDSRARCTSTRTEVGETSSIAPPARRRSLESRRTIAAAGGRVIRGWPVGRAARFVRLRVRIRCYAITAAISPGGNGPAWRRRRRLSARLGSRGTAMRRRVFRLVRPGRYRARRGRWRPGRFPPHRERSTGSGRPGDQAGPQAFGPALEGQTVGGGSSAAVRILETLGWGLSFTSGRSVASLTGIARP
jgi:hypothetical protein